MIHEIVHLLIHTLDDVIFWVGIRLKLMLQLRELDVLVEVPSKNDEDVLGVVFCNDLECVLNACLPQFTNFNCFFKLNIYINKWITRFDIIVEERFVNFAVFKVATAL